MLRTEEICLIKGLLRRQLLSQQQIIAAFSFPDRTVNHNVISAISRGIRYGNDVDYPPAHEAECETFLEYLTWHCAWHDPWMAMRYPAPFSFSYSYHPVGQGLFCSGHFTRRHRGPFRWVYDCGTQRGNAGTRRGDHVRREIGALARQQPYMAAPGARPHIDLVALSHFDEDHLSGMLDLFKTFSVGILLLPYLAPWDRLVIALEERAAVGSNLLSFLLAPVEFLARVEGAEIGRILWVPASGEGGALGPLLPADGGGPEGDIALGPHVEAKGEPFVEEDDIGGTRSATRISGGDGETGTDVEMLPRGAAITVDRLWEFVPYNDASLAGLATPAFKSNACALARSLVDAKSDAARKAALDDLTDLYDDRFKTPASPKISAERRNRISLYLYSAPIGDVELVHVTEAVLRHRLDAAVMHAPTGWLGTDRFGQLFTGDGFLATAGQWTGFSGFYGAHGRLRRGAIFQVMHHGSEHNWQAGLAVRIDPVASLFCSDPAGKDRHPSERVLLDFAPYNPKQIDAFHGWTIRGGYRFR